MTCAGSFFDWIPRYHLLVRLPCWCCESIPTFPGMLLSICRGAVEELTCGLVPVLMSALAASSAKRCWALCCCSELRGGEEPVLS